MNFTWDAMSVKPPLMSQSSIYSLTFDELQNTVGGVGKDFGSMNMDELLKNIWNVEETQTLTSSVVEGPNPIGNNLQRQGSLTLPRTLSQRKVDEVWRDLMKDSGNSGSSMPQRQATLGEVTLEEFLVRAGVVKEDAPPPPPNHAQQIERPDNNKWFSDFSRSNNNTNLLPFQQPNGNNGNGDLSDNNNLAPKQLPPSSLNPNQSHRPPPLFPKPTNVAFAAPIHLLNNAQLGNPGRSVVPSVGMFGLSAANVVAPVGSPGSKMSPDAITKHNVDPSLPSPVPYGINRGRKGGAVEKVVERRQRRMIKNRESAARSRARKQAYTVELEAEVAKLKEVNEELQRKQAEFLEMQKNKEDLLRTNKIKFLRRTLTGPW
ncbi:unnamed protein product [Trifolium pratense]|uniref:Uncharacterized protein n=1 Tax=Trifolium pratense TaxID=57577 RepID=A0ACB0K303_TRIPR|nr:unnamed protein product [Trifolium pratense]